MTLSIGQVTTDSTDPGPLARWWADVTGGQVVAEHDGWFYIVQGPGGAFAFQKVDAVTPGKNKVHVDFATTDDLDAVADELVAAGASLVAKRGDDAFRWITLTDPQGNEFCVASEHLTED
ncbi:VOC family protein [Beutenbergia cavernae]|nr:VOC family protein [Beutenbergia cavernae]